MSEIQTKDKLITLEELGVALNGKAGVTSVNNQTGAVSITPVNIGAAADSAAMQFRGWCPNGQSMLSLTPGYYRTKPDSLPSEFPNSINEYGTLCVDDTGYTHITYISVLGDFMFWASNLSSSSSAKWCVVQNNGCVPVSSGGTGATTAAGARANLDIHSGSNVVYFTNGSATVPFSTFGLNSRPSTLVATLSNVDGSIRYDWDNSASNIVLVCLDLNRAPITGSMRFSWIAIP